MVTTICTTRFNIQQFYLLPTQCIYVFCVDLRFDLLKPSGCYMYRQFNIQQFYILPTQCIYVFCVHLRTKSDSFPTHH